MGLFGFIGKAVKGVAKGIGSVAKFGLTSGLLPIPGGGLAGKLAGTLLQHKTPLGGTAGKILLRSPILMRGQSPMRSGYMKATTTTYGGTRPPAPVLRASPVMPGGAVATPHGIASRTSSPPGAYAGAAAGVARRRRKRTAAKSRKRRTDARRKRRLKFGSPAWRKKYLGHGRKRRKRAA